MCPGRLEAPRRCGRWLQRRQPPVTDRGGIPGSVGITGPRAGGRGAVRSGGADHRDDATQRIAIAVSAARCGSARLKWSRVHAV